MYHVYVKIVKGADWTRLGERVMTAKEALEALRAAAETTLEYECRDGHGNVVGTEHLHKEANVHRY